jgi:hypothetical protein
MLRTRYSHRYVGTGKLNGTHVTQPLTRWETAQEHSFLAAAQCFLTQVDRKNHPALPPQPPIQAAEGNPPKKVSIQMLSARRSSPTDLPDVVNKLRETSAKIVDLLWNQEEATIRIINDKDYVGTRSIYNCLQTLEKAGLIVRGELAISKVHLERVNKLRNSNLADEALANEYDNLGRHPTEATKQLEGMGKEVTTMLAEIQEHQVDLAAEIEIPEENPED